jgi:hypothetical protein
MLMPIAGNVKLIFDLIFPSNIVNFLHSPFRLLSLIEYKIPFGSFAYNIALKIEKTS